MELQLKVYFAEEKNGTTTRKVKKTYKADTLFLSFGVLEDVFNVLAEVETKAELTQTQLGLIVIKNRSILKTVIKDIFVGISDEEINATNTFDFINLFKDVYLGCLELLSNVQTEKN